MKLVIFALEKHILIAIIVVVIINLNKLHQAALK